MEANNPFFSGYDEEQDKDLVVQAIGGSRKALNQLLEHHNTFIYNIALKMLGDLAEAQDLTQDILIKITTNLAKYDARKGKFRSWLYRLTFNHILDHQKSPLEKRIRAFPQFFESIESVKDEPISVDEGYLEEDHPYTKEVKMKCTSGMLMCLSREQRLLYVVGEIFDVDHGLGAEIFNTSKENFRKRLSRIRKDLHQWMHDKCGLVNKANPCRCNKKTKGFIDRGIVDPERLIWNSGYKERIDAYVQNKFGDLQESADTIYARLYRQHPMKQARTSDEVLTEVLGNRDFKEILEL